MIDGPGDSRLDGLIACSQPAEYRLSASAATADRRLTAVGHAWDWSVTDRWQAAAKLGESRGWNDCWKTIAPRAVGAAQCSADRNPNGKILVARMPDWGRRRGGHHKFLRRKVRRYLADTKVDYRSHKPAPGGDSQHSLDFARFYISGRGGRSSSVSGPVDLAQAGRKDY